MGGGEEEGEGKDAERSQKQEKEKEKGQELQSFKEKCLGHLIGNVSTIS